MTTTALLTYSTKPRGGVVHTLSLAEALHARGQSVQIIALGDPDKGFFRPTPVPHTILPAPSSADSLEEKVFDSIDALEKGLTALEPDVDILHPQDCISSRAAARVRDARGGVRSCARSTMSTTSPPRRSSTANDRPSSSPTTCSW